ncbi:MAG: hypothetical protein B6D72_08210 [gamma proteobacterium symbiont of Ctena orbiculata]|nr:MAG: hypothetical protein B6D72_08210 [gamma proteobacterium symbiont of Ctena orbiculata]PVV16392.1 MAG: hypothetical protein B6D82_01105 [gamma proteobacterium symbiont of Ctena orbiculata]PVV23484.1 MAG: hypothetical protein B6D74_07605 [gamma proteobacterium symbiont of Ctena orbiculata]
MLAVLNLAGVGRWCVIEILVLMVASSVVCAAEIDSVTTRSVALENSRAAINRIFNQRIKRGIDEANRKRISIHSVGDLELYREGEYCDEQVLYRELRKAIFESNTATWGLKGYHIDVQLRSLLARKSYSLPLNDSIYRDIDYLEGISLNLKELSDVVKVERELIGVDKLGHFFAEGWRYFEMVAFDDKSLYDALAWGREKESGLFGYSTTGIFSYADLVANFNGMRFWNRVLLKQDDPLTGVIANLLQRPYVTCDIQIVDSFKAGKVVKAWEFNREFDIGEFIDASWDEGNNCNSYADPLIEAKVTKRIRDVDPDFACPSLKAACSRSRVKYGDYARFLLHPSCLNAE